MIDTTRIRRLLDERKPGYTLPQAFYVDPEIFEFDLEAIHARSWMLAGFEVEVPDPGSTLALSIGRTPIVVVRGRDTRVRTFYNICRHRGSQVCAPGRTRRPRLVCPYHQWAYDLQGRLVHATRMAVDFDPSEHGLRPIRTETVAGAIYVCLAEDPPDFAPFRASVEPLLAPHRLADAKLAVETTLVERGNWKLAMENARECYHCPARHPELCVTFPVDGWRSSESGVDDALPKFAARMQEADLPVGPADGPWWQAARFPLANGAVSLSMDGKPNVKKRMVEAGGGDIGSMRLAIEPHVFAHATGDSFFIFSANPTAAEETIVTSKWFVHKDAVEGTDYTIDDLTKLWTITNLQDRDLVENNQRGVNGRGFVPGPYAPESESLVLRFVDWYCKKALSHLEANV